MRHRSTKTLLRLAPSARRQPWPVLTALAGPASAADIRVVAVGVTGEVDGLGNNALCVPNSSVTFSGIVLAGFIGLTKLPRRAPT